LRSVLEIQKQIRSDAAVTSLNQRGRTEGKEGGEEINIGIPIKEKGRRKIRKEKSNYFLVLLLKRESWRKSRKNDLLSGRMEQTKSRRKQTC